MKRKEWKSGNRERKESEQFKGERERERWQNREGRKERKGEISLGALTTRVQYSHPYRVESPIPLPRHRTRHTFPPSNTPTWRTTTLHRTRYGSVGSRNPNLKVKFPRGNGRCTIVFHSLFRSPSPLSSTVLASGLDASRPSSYLLFCPFSLSFRHSVIPLALSTGVAIKLITSSGM